MHLLYNLFSEFSIKHLKHWTSHILFIIISNQFWRNLILNLSFPLNYDFNSYILICDANFFRLVCFLLFLLNFVFLNFSFQGGKHFGQRWLISLSQIILVWKFGGGHVELILMSLYMKFFSHMIQLLIYADLWKFPHESPSFTNVSFW